MKRLVVCLDGTWNTPDSGSRATNVVRIMRAIRPADDRGTAQVVFYDKGVGTSGVIDRVRGGAFGRGLDDNVKDGYRFLANNYHPDDEIYLFGFSRGAFTARSLGGFIGLCGLLNKNTMGRLPDAFRFYRTSPGERSDSVRDAIRSLSRYPVDMTCIGVWDTVGALGIPLEAFQYWNRHKYAFHNTEIGDRVQHAFHAIAIDEKRGPFAPTLWQKPSNATRNYDHVEQVWFCGVHSNVGGGYEDRRLSDLALRWMCRRVEATTGLALDPGEIPGPVADHHLGEIVESRGGFYAVSHALPMRRLIDQNDADGSWWRPRNLRTSRPEPGFEFINEKIHVSATRRYGQMAPFNGREERYEPDNLAAAKGNVAAVDDEGNAVAWR